MPQALISVVRGDYNYTLNFTLTDDQGAVLDLSGATLTFKAQLLSDLSVQFTGSMAIIVAADGTCSYTVASTDFPLAGDYNCQIMAAFGAGQHITFPDIRVTVEDSVPVS